MYDETVIELACWVDSLVIAEAIVDCMLEENIEPSLETAKKIWLDVLETELPQAIRSSVLFSPAL